VTIPAGQLTAPIPVSTVALGTTMVQVSLNGTSAESAVSVIPPPPAVLALTPSPLSVVVGPTGQLTVTLNAAQVTNTDVTLTVDQSAVLHVPPTVTVPAHHTQAVFTMTGLAVGDAVVTASVGASSRQATVHVIPPPPVPVSLLPDPLPLQQGATGMLTLTINAAQLNDTSVPLTTSETTILQIPASITVPAGHLTALVPVTALLAGTATVSATLNGVTVSSTVQVSPPPPVVTSLTPATLSVPKGRPGTLRVTLSRASTQVEEVMVTSSAPGVAQGPAMVPIPAGALFADFPVLSLAEGSAVITATLNGGSATSTVTVTPAEVVSLTLAPQDPTRFVGEQAQLTATGTYTDGTTADLTTQVIWTSSNESVATITSSGLVTALTVGTSLITASFTNPSGPPPMTASTPLTVLTPPALALMPAAATLQVGQSQAFTVSTGLAPGPGGLPVTFTLSGAGTATLSTTTVVIPAGVSTVPDAVTVTATGPGPVTLTATAPIRTPGTATLTLTPGIPMITEFTPLSGPMGTVVTITGTSFHNVAAENQVKFNGKPAIVASATETSLITTVPQGATTGPVTVTTAQGTGTSAQAFSVAAPDFSLSALPSLLTIPASGQGAVAVSITGTSGFTNLATLSVTGVPSGASAAFSSATLTAGQGALLTLVTNGMTPAGAYPLTVTATGPVHGVQTTRSTTVTLQVLGAGATILSGQVRDEDDKPVKNALVKLGILQVITDDGGNFLMQNPPVGADQLLFIDGGPASTPGRSLPIVPYKVTIVAGQNNTLGFIPRLHFQKTTGFVDISNSAVERVVTDPELPGFMMTIPTGATITGWDGQPNTKVSVRRVPIDRTPLPPVPADSIAPVVYMDFFDKPGGGTPSEPIPITYPNDLGVPPGTQVELWYYDEAPDGTRPNQWAQYGTGTVSADGSQVIPDINPATGKPFGQPRFCCGARFVRMIQSAFANILNQVGGVAVSNGGTGGDPVDLATGLFLLQKTDLVLPGRLPVTVTRYYRTNGTSAGPFGPGTSHTFHVLLLIQSDLRTVVLPQGNRVAFVRQPDGTYRNGMDPAFRGAVLGSAGAGHMLRLKDGTTWTFGDAIPTTNTAFLIGQADRNGNTITIARSGAAQNATTITDASGRALSLTYDGGNRITVIQDPLGRTIRYDYDALGRLAMVTDPEGGVTRYTYDPAGRMLTLTDARGITFLTNEYDSAGRVSRQTQADSGLWQFAYTTTNGIITQTTVTDPRGQKTTTRFNGQTYPVEHIDSLGQATVTARGAASNLVLSTTDPVGRKTAFEYDAAGNVTKIIDPALHETRFTYDAQFNRVQRITDALNQITEFTYDPANGNLLTVTDPLNHITTIAYNAFGQPTSVQGPIPSEPPTTFAYDADGNLITTTDPLGNVTQRIYDAVSRLVSLTDPRGAQTQFQYDALNRVTAIADARHGLTAFSHDPNGNLLTVTDAKSQPTTYAYDSMDRLATRTDVLNRQESYQYDPVGNLTQFTDRKGQQTTFTYDALNRRTGAQYADGSSTSFTHDAVGRLTQATDSLVGAIDFVYDQLDRLIKEISAQGLVEYTYDALGRRTTMTANGQAPVSYQYDAASRLIQVAHAGLVVGLGYDATGRRTSLTYPNGTSTTYSYDNASRLTNIIHTGPAGLIESLSYTYDAAGNRISLTRANGSATLLPAAVQAAYDAANEQIAFNSQPATFDANGNQTTSTDATGTTTYTWDVRNRLTAITGPTLSASFTYDALGRRVSKTVNGQTTGYLYDGNDIVQEIGGGAISATYLRSLNIDEPFIRQAGSNEHYHTDALGSVLALTNVAGALQTSYSYEPFGKTTITGTSSNPFQYTGRENDQPVLSGVEGGLYYYRARYYSSTLHRFLVEDPVGLSGSGINLYTYVLDNPLKYVDAIGLRVNLNGQVVGNPYVLANLQRLNGVIIELGIPDDKFELRVTGGDRYLDFDGTIRSLTDDREVRDSSGRAAKRKSCPVRLSGGGIRLIDRTISRRNCPQHLIVH
jgi:RHS repeat-associated protein